MPPPARILIACDKFKGSLSAPDACAAIARGLATVWPAATIDTCPIADGGEGFAAAIDNALPGGQWITLDAHDALGRPITARYLLVEEAGKPVAIMEMAEASGLWRIAPEDRDILRANTLGTGEMIRHAVTVSHASRIVLGIGGSATNDGGAGMAAALGVRFLDAAGKVLAPDPAVLASALVACDLTACITLPPVIAACDVTSPLLGPDGATRVFGPQKGADATTIPVLEAALDKLSRLSNGSDHALCPGAGAAGGLGFGLLHFAGAKLVPGFDLLAGLTGLDHRIAAADLVITGEGSLDFQSLAGKGPAGIANLAAQHHKPVWAFCGTADPAARASGLFARIADLTSTGLPIDTLMRDAASLLATLATTTARTA